VPQPVAGWDWGCALQITGLKTAWRRPRYVFGVDAIQTLHLAMKHAGVILESAAPKLAWLGEKGNLGMPRFLPDLPKREQDRLKSMVEREAVRFWKGVVRASKKKASRRNRLKVETA
jgi:hypothetical protein